MAYLDSAVCVCVCVWCPHTHRHADTQTVFLCPTLFPNYRTVLSLLNSDIHSLPDPRWAHLSAVKASREQSSHRLASSDYSRFTVRQADTSERECGRTHVTGRLREKRGITGGNWTVWEHLFSVSVNMKATRTSPSLSIFLLLCYYYYFVQLGSSQNAEISSFQSKSSPTLFLKPLKNYHSGPKWSRAKA